MWSRYADAVLYQWARAGSVLHLDGVHLVAAGVDDVVAAPLQVEHTVGRDDAEVGGIDLSLPEDLS